MEVNEPAEGRLAVSPDRNRRRSGDPLRPGRRMSVPEPAGVPRCGGDATATGVPCPAWIT